MMDLDQLKATWQAAQFVAEEKEMNEIQRILQRKLVTLMGRITRRYGNVLTSALIGMFAYVLIFVSMGDGLAPAGFLPGLLFFISFIGLVWWRYRQLVTFDYALPLKQQLQQLVAQRERDQRIDLVVWPLGLLLLASLPRVLSGAGWPDFAATDVLIGLAVALVAGGAVLAAIWLGYRRDLAQLGGLLGELE